MLTFTPPVACAVIGRTRHKMIQAEILQAAKQGAKLIELRLDFLSKAPDFKRLLLNRPCPMIATFRRPADGGRWNGTEDQRLMLMRHAVVAGFDYLDVEVDIADQVPRFGATKRIVSYHNLREVPEKFELIYEQMCEEDADIIKICVTAQTIADNFRVMAILKNPIKPTIAFCMGDLGTCTRLIGLKLGMPYTYGTFNRERQIAPGILPFQDLQKIYHVEKITADTKVFGVVGDPVGHSLSPLIHNAALRALGIDALYLPIRVPRGELTAALQSFRAIPIDGYSVTIPHKEAAAKLATEADDTVATMGAANTLLATEAGFRAVNTDAQAAIESLRAKLPLDADGKQPPLSSRTVLILGAGGVARAVAHGLHKEGTTLFITNRTEERGVTLAEEVSAKFVEWSARHNVTCDTIINCTSVGMHPNLDESPLHHSFLAPSMLVFDTIYTPETTMLIREATTRGCPVLTGVDMFVRQAGLQFQLFTGQEPPLELMTKVVRRALSPVQMLEETPGEPSRVSDRVVPAERADGVPAAVEPLAPTAGPATNCVMLIGYRGTGKTTVARILAHKLKWGWRDADSVLEERFDKSIRDIFEREGESRFRDKETRILTELCGLSDHVIATGGGVILRPGNCTLLKRATVVWLHATPSVLWKRIQADASSAGRRPDLAQCGLAEIEALLRERTPLYEACANFTVDTSAQTPVQVAETILAWLRPSA